MPYTRQTGVITHLAPTATQDASAAGRRRRRLRVVVAAAAAAP